jgi:hypothetical protein
MQTDFVDISFPVFLSPHPQPPTPNPQPFEAKTHIQTSGTQNGIRFAVGYNFASI